MIQYIRSARDSATSLTCMPKHRHFEAKQSKPLMLQIFLLYQATISSGYLKLYTPVPSHPSLLLLRPANQTVQKRYLPDQVNSNPTWLHYVHRRSQARGRVVSGAPPPQMSSFLSVITDPCLILGLAELVLHDRPETDYHHQAAIARSVSSTRWLAQYSVINRCKSSSL